MMQTHSTSAPSAGRHNEHGHLSRPVFGNTVLGLGAVMVMACCHFAASQADAAMGPDTPESLTVQETVGFAFMRAIHGNVRPCFTHANPGAKDALRRVLSDRALAEYHSQVWRLLGYIGDASDVERVERALAGMPPGVLDYFPRESVRGTFDALGVMSRRGIAEADRLVEKMASLDYWRKQPFRWYPEDAIKKRPEFEYEPLTFLLWGYSLSGNMKRCAELAASILKGIEDDKVRQYVASGVRPALLAERAERVLREEQLPLAPGWHKALAEQYDKHAATVARLTLDKSQVDPEEAAFLRGVATEAVAEFEKLRAALFKGELDGVKGHLLDNGKLVHEALVRQRGADLDNALHRQQGILQALAERELKPVDFTVERSLTYGLPALPEPEGQVAATRSEEITVTFRLSGTSEVGRVLLPRLRASRTVAQDYSLIVFMKKIDGRWYWNPFGW